MNTILRIGSLQDVLFLDEEIAHRLEIARQKESLHQISEIYFWNIHLTTKIVMALKKLLLSDPVKHWNSIKIMSCTGEIDSTVGVVLKSQRVHNLVVSGSVITDAMFSQLLNAGHGKGKQSVTVLRCLSTRFTEQSPMGNLLLDNLEELDLSRSRLQKRNVLTLARAFLRNAHELRTLKLEYCSIPDDVLSPLLQACTQCPTLQNLHLSHNSCGHASVVPLALLIQNLESLDLHCQHYIHDWSGLFNALKKSRTLKRLILSGNQLSGIGETSALASALESNPSLEYLSLQDCQLSDDDVQCLAQSFSRWKRLTSLNLSGNLFLESGALALVEGLEQNFSLQCFGHLYYYTCSERMEYYLDCNYWGTRQMLMMQQEKKIPLALWPYLLARLNVLPLRIIECPSNRFRARRESIIYSLLHGPALFER